MMSLKSGDEVMSRSGGLYVLGETGERSARLKASAEPQVA